MALYNLFPIRCFTCGKVLGGKVDAFEAHLKSSPLATMAQFFTDHKIERYCCRRMFLTHVQNVPQNTGVSSDRIVNDVEALRRL